MNKKVLLRERKKHTTRRVASARGRGTYLGWGEEYLPWTGVGVSTLGYPLPHPDLGGGEGYLPLGTPSSLGQVRMGEGVPQGRNLSPIQGKYPLPPQPGQDGGRGYLPWMEGGVPTLGYPLPHVDGHTPVKTLPSPSFG